MRKAPPVTGGAPAPGGYAGRLRPMIERWRRARSRVAIFGAGAHTDLLLREVPELAAADLVAILDNDPGRQGTTVHGLPIHPATWAAGHADVIVCSSFVNEPAMAASVAHLGCEVVLTHPGERPRPAPRTRAYHGRVAAAAPASATATNPLDVVVLPIIDWYYRFQRPQQLALGLARRGHRVFYVRNTFHDGKRALVRELAPHLYEVTLPASRPVNVAADAIEPGLLEMFAEALAALSARRGLRRVHTLVDLPFWWPLAERMRAQLGWRVVYDCMDEHRGFAATSDQMLALEAPLAAGSDLLLASSEPLAARLRTTGRQVELLPNGVDFDHFVEPTGRPPRAFDRLAGPVIGYYGAVSTWFDTALVARLAAARPAWSFAVIGATSGADLAPLSGVSNVRLWPEQRYERIPAFLHRFAAGIIPFKRTPLTDATNPVKLYEYWAAGKPVIATRLTELERFEPMVTLAATDAEWLEGLDLALAADQTGPAAARREWARRNTWAVRAEALEAALERLDGK